MKLVAFASGRGSNFEAICKAVKAKKLRAEILALVCNVKNAPVLKIAKRYGVRAIVVPNDGLSRSQHEELVLKELLPLKPDWIVLAGYMRLLTPEFLRAFRDESRGIFRVINIHPSLLPSFPGKDGYAQAWEHGVCVTGATVHLVGSGVDDGPILDQSVLEVLPKDTVASLTKRGLTMEHKLYINVLSQMSKKEFKVRGRRVEWEAKR